MGNSWFWIGIASTYYVCYTRGFLTTSFVIGKWGRICSSWLLWIVDGYTIPNSDFMEISRGFRKTHPKETCQQLPSASHGELNPSSMVCHFGRCTGAQSGVDKDSPGRGGWRALVSYGIEQILGTTFHNVPQQTQREFVWPGSSFSWMYPAQSWTTHSLKRGESQIRKFNL